MKFKTQVITCFGIIYGIYAIFSAYQWIGINNYEQEIKNYLKSYRILNLTYSIQEGLNVYSKESRELFANPSSELKEHFTKKGISPSEM